MSDEADAAKSFFVERGFDVAVSERDLHAEHLANGEHGRASFFKADQMYVCVDLLRDGATVASDYASGETLEQALSNARRRFGSEQS